MIDERMEEQAGLYVLGVLTSEETRTFEAALSRDSELQQLVAALHISRDAVAGSLPQTSPPPSLKEKILAQIAAQEKIIPLPVRAEKASVDWHIWVPWALAACLTILCAVSLSQQKALRQKIGEQANQMVDLDQTADSLRIETQDLKHMMATLQETNLDLNRTADSLRNQTQDLKHAVATLQETNRLANLRIAMLGSMLSDSPKAVAVSLWDDKEQRGVFVVQNLKPLPADKDYQLWVIDPKYPTPVSAGVFQVDAEGNVRLQFKADKLIASPQKFAVTQEPKGGLPVPTLKNLVLIGG